MCYCAEKVQGVGRCTLEGMSNAFPCRLNAVEAMVGNSSAEEDDAGDGGKPKADMVTGAGGKGKGKGVAAGAVVVAAMGAVAGMTL